MADWEFDDKLRESVMVALDWARRNERQRIIALLEGVAYLEDNGDVMVAEFKDDLVALIRGEDDAG
jgi:hypothetical protein